MESLWQAAFYAIGRFAECGPTCPKWADPNWADLVHLVRIAKISPDNSYIDLYKYKAISPIVLKYYSYKTCIHLSYLHTFKTKFTACDRTPYKMCFICTQI